MTDRATAALQIARDGGVLALEYFRRVGDLKIIDKGVQDFVTEADQNVETHVRSLIEKAFPEDGIVGEEHAPKQGTSGYTWVIDPIDGTTNFVSAIPFWCVVLAVVKDDATEIGVIHDAVHSESFHAVRGGGAFVNDTPIKCPPAASMDRGSINVGYCNRSGKEVTTKLVAEILQRDGVFTRFASGALSLAHMAAGRTIGYIEEHMNAWDCLAGQLIIAEAGGCVEDQSADAMIKNGGRVVAGSAGVFDTLVEIADDLFPNAS